MTDVRDIPLELIDDPELALRLEIDEEELESLAASIRAQGLNVPLIVKPVGDRWEVVDGHRRLLALRRNRASTAACKVHDREDVPTEAVKLSCNIDRVGNTDAEIASWLCDLADKHGYNLEQICDLVKKSPSWVNDRVGLMRGHREVFEANARKEISFAQAKELNKIKREDVMRIALHYAIVDGLSADRIREYYRRNEIIMPAATDGQPPVPEGVSTEQVTVTPVACEVCGGNQDTVNLESHLMHRWHWLDLLKAMRNGSTRDAT